MFNYIEYRSVSDMNELILRNLSKFPHDVDMVIGIPRSGMIPANLIALYLNKPLADIDSFAEGRKFSCGERGENLDDIEIKSVLIVDDSIGSGNALKKVKEKLKDKNLPQIKYAAIFASARGKTMVDIYCEEIEGPRVFQWNIFHHTSFLPRTCVDIDGVLCQNPPDDDDGEKYIQYISNAAPLIIPTVEIDMLVSCRLEKYRPQTEKWLKDNGVKYKRLIMLNMPTKEERIKWGKHGEYKGMIYKKSDNILFIESSLAEAGEICRVSGKQVYCIENFQMLYSQQMLNRGGKS